MLCNLGRSSEFTVRGNCACRRVGHCGTKLHTWHRYATRRNRHTSGEHRDAAGKYGDSASRHRNTAGGKSRNQYFTGRDYAGSEQPELHAGLDNAWIVSGRYQSRSNHSRFHHAEQPGVYGPEQPWLYVAEQPWHAASNRRHHLSSVVLRGSKVLS